jgi:hypothetical protein
LRAKAKFFPEGSMTKNLTKMACLSFILFLGLFGCTIFQGTENPPTINPEATENPMTTQDTDPACVQLNLTPEECANAGTHDYLITGEQTSGNCTFYLSDQPSLLVTNPITINFSTNDMEFIWFYTASFAKDTENTYRSLSFSNTDSGVSGSEVLVFSADGFRTDAITTFDDGSTCISFVTFVRQ